MTAKKDSPTYSIGDVVKIENKPMMMYGIVIPYDGLPEWLWSQTRRNLVAAGKAVCLELNTGEYDVYLTSNLKKINPYEELTVVQAVTGNFLESSDMTAWLKGQASSIDCRVASLEEELNLLNKQRALVQQQLEGATKIPLNALSFLRRAIELS